MNFGVNRVAGTLLFISDSPQPDEKSEVALTPDSLIPFIKKIKDLSP